MLVFSGWILKLRMLFLSKSLFINGFLYKSLYSWIVMNVFSYVKNKFFVLQGIETIKERGPTQCYNQHNMNVKSQARFTLRL